MAFPTKIPLFRRFVLQNFPFIEQDFDALTDYQLICKVVEYLNKVIEVTNETTGQVELLTTAFTQLKDYVDHYFDNLDVQEEINNKLDEMVEDGTLENLITPIVESYIQLNTVMYFDDINAMKNATNVENPGCGKTLGFYQKGDGGGAFYRIREKEPNETPNEISSFALQNDLVADFISESIMNVKQLGAKGNGTNNDTQYISYAIANYNNIYIPSGTYMINTGFTLRSNQYIHGENNTILKQIDSSNITNIFSGTGISNISIKNIKIDLNADNQTYTTPANQGRGILLSNSCNNITIDGFNTDRIYGSFIYIVDSTYITIKNCKIKDPQGMYSTFGCYLVRTQHSVCEYCEFTGVREYGTALSSYGFQSKDSSLDILVTHCRFDKMQCIIDGSKNDGTGTYSTQVKIIDNFFVNTPGDTTIRYSRYGLMSNNITRGSGDFGLSVGNSEFINVCNNVVEGSNTVGIGIRISSQCVIANNNIINPCKNFRNMSLVANQRDGIYVLGNSRRCNITGNIIICTDSPSGMYSAIAVEDVSGGTPGADDSFAVICCNTTYGSNTTAIRAESAKNVIDNNYIPS